MSAALAGPGQAAPMGRRGWRLSWLLFGLAAAVLLPALAVGVTAMGIALSGQRAVAENRLRDAARSLGLAVDAEIGADLRTLATLAVAPVLDPERGERAAAETLLREASAALGQPIGWIAPDGEHLAHTGLSPGAVPPPVGQRAALGEALRTGRPVVIGLVTGAVAQAPTAAAMVPVLRGGRRVAVLAVAIRPERLRGVLVAAPRPPGSFAMLVDAADATVARSDALHGELLGRRLPEENARALTAAPSGLFRGTALDGTERVFGFQHLRSAPGWAVLVGEPPAAFAAGWRSAVWVFGTGGMGVLLLAGAAARLTARRIVPPLRKLIAHARAMAGGGAGSAAALSRTGIVEFDQLRQGFAAAETALRAREAEIGRVLAATSDGVFAMDAEWRLTLMNGHAREWMAAGGDLTGRKLWEVFPKAVGGPFWRAYQRSMAERVTTTADGFSAALGRHFHAECHPRAQGGVVVYFRDVTDERLAAKRLAESEARFRGTFEQAAVGVAHTGLDRRLLRVNGRFCAMLCRSETELVGRDLDEITHPDDRGAGRAEVERLLKGEVSTCSFQKRYLRKDGLPVWAELTVSLLLESGTGEPLHFIVVVQDVSQRRAAETALRESEATLQAVLEALPVGVAIADPAGRILRDNSAHRALWGIAPEQEGGWEEYGEWVGFWPETGRRIAAEEWAMTRALLKGEVVTGELVACQPFGGTALRWFLNNAAPVRDEAGRIIGGVVAELDVTEARRAEQALAESERLLRLALDASDLGAWRWEIVEGRPMLEWDRRCRAMFGIGAEAPLEYADWASTLPAEDLAAVEAALARTLDPAVAEDDFATEYRMRRPDGALRWVAATGRAFFAEDAAAPGGRRAERLIGTMRDVTTLREAEQRRARADALLRTIVDTAPGMIYAKDRDGRWMLANPPVLKAIGRSWAEAEGRIDLELLDDHVQATRVMAHDRQIMEAGEVIWAEEMVGHAGGRPRVWLSTKSPLRGEDGAVIGLVGVSMEITERKRAEERLRLLLHELNHRVKNTLATVQSITVQSLRGADPELRELLESRLLALAAAHDVLTREGWAGAKLHEVVAGALAPHGGEAGGRFRISGPPLSLQPRAALAIAMALHELATNALKYGALSTPGGQVEIDWDLAEGAPFRLEWRERGGPPVVPPTRRGFGSRLVERSLAQDLGGTARLLFPPGGVTCVVEAPPGEVLAPAAAPAFPHVGCVQEASC